MGEGPGKSEAGPGGGETGGGSDVPVNAENIEGSSGGFEVGPLTSDAEAGGGGPPYIQGGNGIHDGCCLDSAEC